MSLSAYLTRAEWNAAYFVGMHAASVDGADVSDLSGQLREGIARLYQRKMQFQGLRFDALAKGYAFEKAVQVCGPDNVNVLAEQFDGSFDPIGRGREFIAWAAVNPTIDVAREVAWLREGIENFENEQRGG